MQEKHSDILSSKKYVYKMFLRNLNLTHMKSIGVRC